jgi:hypothetical protein
VLPYHEGGPSYLPGLDGVPLPGCLPGHEVPLRHPIPWAPDHLRTMGRIGAPLCRSIFRLNRLAVWPRCVSLPCSPGRALLPPAPLMGARRPSSGQAGATLSGVGPAWPGVMAPRSPGFTCQGPRLILKSGGPRCLVAALIVGLLPRPRGRRAARLVRVSLESRRLPPGGTHTIDQKDQLVKGLQLEISSRTPKLWCFKEGSLPKLQAEKMLSH